MGSHVTGWMWKMAWRDSRSSRKRLLLFTVSIMLGVAALVAISSFGKNLEQAINEQGKILLGADLVISGRQPFSPDVSAFLNTIGGRQSLETSFASMASHPKTGSTRLAQVRALQGEFPYYGTLETLPPAAARTFQDGPHALVEESLMLQLGLEVGESIQIGAFSYVIAGRLEGVPGEVNLDITGPRVYIPMAYLGRTKLLQRGALAVYRAYFKFDDAVDTERLVKDIQPRLEEYQLQSETARQRQRRLGRVMENLYRFLNLAGFIALLLGGIGVASAINAYTRQKMGTVAILRCVGARAKQSMGIYMIQALMMGLVGAAGGALLGIGTQRLLPSILADFLPVHVPLSLSWLALTEGVMTGLVITMLFTALPLLSVRKISPLLTLRSSYEAGHQAGKDLIRGIIYALIAFALAAFAVLQTGHWSHGIGFAAGLAVALSVLTGIARLITFLVRRFFPGGWTYVWRQGLANLYRPNNQTVVLVMALGLGTFLISTLYLTQSTLLAQVSLSGSNNNPNMVLFDVQSDQTEDLSGLIRSFNLPLLQQVPVVTMRVARIKGESVEEILKGKRLSRWALQREYRSTYRSELTDSERIIAGAWPGQVDPRSHSIPISLEEEIAGTLQVSIGDEIVFDVQGIEIPTTVGSVREVEWRRMQPNFFVVFPSGVLEEAPQFHVLVTRVTSPDQSARFQRAAVQQFPNVSIIDLTLVLNTIDAVLGKVSSVIRFMALFTILTGLTVLAGAVATSRYQRIQESVLLRTLGASRAQIIRIMVIEYFFLGGLAAGTGMMLALAGSWALARFVFEVTFTLSWIPILVVAVSVIGLTILIGMLNSRGIYNRPPLEVLRVDV